MNHRRNLRKERKMLLRNKWALRKGTEHLLPLAARWGEFLGEYGGHGLAQKMCRVMRATDLHQRA